MNTHNKVSNVVLSNKNKLENIDSLIWSGNSFALSKLLKIDFGNIEYNLPAKTTVTNLVIDKKLNLDDVYYMYCYDKNMSTFRVTPYYNYCEGSKRAGKVELIKN